MNLVHKIQENTGKFNDLYLDNIVLCKREYSVFLNFSSKTVYKEAEKELLKSTVRKLIPDSLDIKEITYSKIYCDEEIAVSETRNILKENYSALDAAVTEIKCSKIENCYNIGLTCCDSIRGYTESNPVSNKISSALNEKFKDNFSVCYNFIDNAEEGKTEKTSSNVYKCSPEPSSYRYIEVFNASPLIGKEIEPRAVYIEDCESVSPKTVICGRVRNFYEKVTKSEKILICFTLEDFTGSITCIMFPGASVIESVRKLQDGSEILVQGELVTDTFTSAVVCRPRQISYCELPKNFKVNEKVSKPEPEKYVTVIPQKIELTSQSNLFDNKCAKLPEFFGNKAFVVFDVETTGLNYDMDRITELGAVKIENGVITESFSTLINPKIHIREETVKLNGIDDGLVKDSPAIEDALPDFYKFTRGAWLVGQNVDFDLKFLKYSAKKSGYYFYNEIYDTLLIARKKLFSCGLSNYKLDTLCRYFNIDLFDHHRAWNDALATARLFIELMCLTDNAG